MLQNELLAKINEDDIYLFGKTNSIEFDKSTFHIVKQSDRGILTKAKLLNEGYIPYLSLLKLIQLNLISLQIKLKYFHGNILAYLNENQLEESVKKSNDIYFVYTREKELCYACIGLPIKPNEIFSNNRLDNIITTVKKFNTLPGSNRVEINYKNNSFEVEDDIPF